MYGDGLGTVVKYMGMEKNMGMGGNGVDFQYRVTIQC